MRPRVRSAILVFGLLVAAAVSYGTIRMQEVKEFEGRAKPWTVGVTQGNVDQSQKWDPAFQQETLKRYRELSAGAVEGTPRAELVVWPETAVPFLYGIEEKLTAQLNEMIKETGVPILFGSPGVTWLGGKARLLNRAYLVDMTNPSNPRISSYAKQHLVPFGEYVPYQKVLFFVSRLVEAAGDFIAGTDSRPMLSNGQAFGVLICYEGIFPDLSRATVKLGATSLINITNDAWYGRTSAPYQSLEMARWRAIEFRVPLIRAANTGVSAIVDANGAVLGSIPLDEKGFLVRTVHPFRTLTMYARWGDFFAWLCVFAAVAVIVYDSMRRRSD
jgi:apolipoprotein N-acyltransferase